MKMYRVWFLAFTLTSVATLAAANAADMYRAPEPVMGGYKDGPVVQSWAGFYIGVNGGYAWNANKVLADTNPAIPGAEPAGGFGGGQIGYNWQGIWHPHLVLGIEADIQGGDIKDRVSPAPGLFAASQLDYFGTVRGRAGYAFDRTLAYFTGGFAYGNLHDSIGTLTRKFDGTVTGYVLGGGLEYKVNPAWSVKAEYQYLNFGRNDATLGGVSVCTIPTVKCEDDAFHTVRAGINYHFGTAYEPLK